VNERSTLLPANAHTWPLETRAVFSSSSLRKMRELRKLGAPWQFPQYPQFPLCVRRIVLGSTQPFGCRRASWRGAENLTACDLLIEDAAGRHRVDYARHPNDAKLLIYLDLGEHRRVA
jgi:hypothetical protein